MATGSGVNQGKGKFLEEFLPDNRDATLVEVNRAWGAAGHDGTISESLYGKIRSRLGLTSRSGSNGRATEEHASRGEGQAQVVAEGGQGQGEEGRGGPAAARSSGRTTRGRAGLPSSGRCWDVSPVPT